MTSLNLRYHSADNGFCRVYYKANSRLYCWQITDYRYPLAERFELLTCSRDGEPSCPVRSDIDITTQWPKGDEPIEHELREFLTMSKS